MINISLFITLFKILIKRNKKIRKTNERITNSIKMDMTNSFFLGRCVLYVTTNCIYVFFLCII